VRSLNKGLIDFKPENKSAERVSGGTLWQIKKFRKTIENNIY